MLTFASRRLCRSAVILAIPCMLFTACARRGFEFPEPTGLVTENAAAVSARVEVSDIGVAIMRDGGTAFDAMIAMEMALAVAYPLAGSLGGGGFAVFRKADGETGALDFREKAPLAAHRDMYLDDNGDPIRAMSLQGAIAAGVPGTVAGIFAMHERFGTRPFAELMAPVIQLAKRGVVVTEYQALRLEKVREKIVAISGSQSAYAQPYKAGDVIVNRALADTLERLVEGGRDAFYRGDIAKEIVNFLQAHGGVITEEDLARYRTVWREPIEFRYKDLNIISMSPPSSGGITLQQILSMIEPYDISQYEQNSLAAIQLMVEAERRAYADRNHFLGDPDMVSIPYEELTDPEYLQQRMASFSFDTATLSSELEHGQIEVIESDETTHYSIVDAYGNALAVTTTINGAYGSKLYSDELGFFFNNQMDDFSVKPGAPNMFGLIGSEANSIQPEKRMLSSMTPTIIEKNGKLFMVLGAPGGSTIITSVAQAILNVYEFGLSMQEAVDAPRFHHQWMPDLVLFERDGFPDALLDQIKDKGYAIRLGGGPISGKVDAILVRDDKTMESGADRRGDDTAAGF